MKKASGQKGGNAIDTAFREIRNHEHHLLCMANESTGEVKTQGPHHSLYLFILPVGSTISVERGNCRSLITRTATAFIVADYAIAA